MIAIAGTSCILLALSLLLASRLMPILAYFAILFGLLGVSILMEVGDEDEEA